jgi:diguanylate cyclase (GGDEF)-like protein
MIDVDHFKLFNDSYGHLVGDKVLVEVAKAVKKSLRPTDFFARYGGEEFVIVVGECGKHEIELVAERIRKIIESVEIENEGDLLKVTASAGGAYGNRFNNVSDGVEMVRLADKCLYQSKESGRNQCTFAEFTPRACQSSSS